MIKPLRLSLLFLCFVTAAWGQAGQEVPFDRPANADEGQAITYMMNELGNKGVLTLGFQRGQLQAAGDRTRQLHPLQFFLYIFKNPQLRADLIRMRSRGKVWKDFMAGMAQSFNEQANLGNITEEQVDNYAQQLNIDPAPLWQQAQQRNWQGFIDATLKELGQPAGAGGQRGNGRRSSRSRQRG